MNGLLDLALFSVTYLRLPKASVMYEMRFGDINRLQVVMSVAFHCPVREGAPDYMPDESGHREFRVSTRQRRSNGPWRNGKPWSGPLDGIRHS